MITTLGFGETVNLAAHGKSQLASVAIGRTVVNELPLARPVQRAVR